MKNLLIIFTLLLSLNSFGQLEMSDFYSNKTQVVFLGLDFTLCKFINKKTFNSPDGLKNHAIKSWNRFLASEPRKYSLQDAFGLKDKYYYNSINYFLKRNDSINTYRAITNEPYSITKEQVIKNISTYNTFEKEGLAVSFVVESFDDLKEEAHYWVAFIDLKENRVIHLQKMVTKPGGFGQVNYWARSIYNAVTEIEKQTSQLKKL